MMDSLITSIDLVAIANQFALGDRVLEVEPLGNGIINDTFLVQTDSPTQPNFVLQRVNTQVFRQPQLVMENMCAVTEHMRQRLQDSPLERRWELPQVLRTNGRQNHYRDTENSFWRALSFIPQSYCVDIIRTPQQAQEIGYALGLFHYLVSDLPAVKLADTLPGFHITPTYFQAYQQVRDSLGVASRSQSSHQDLSPEVEYCLQFVRERQNSLSVLEDAKQQGFLPVRIMHGDPKINNIMLDEVTHKSVSVIDLDTVKPGLIHYDIGDCLRSGCNPAGEETQNWQDVVFDVDVCKHLLQGYLSSAQAFLREQDYLYIYAAIRLITFELGLRFFTDYLAGNAYFKVQYPEHNLIRALVQFQLTASIEQQETIINKIIRSVQ